MSFWSGFSFMSRSRDALKNQERYQGPPVGSATVPDHDQSRSTSETGLRFDQHGETSFLDHVECQTDTYCGLDDSSRHLSLTTASLKRLVKEENGVNNNITLPKTLAAAQTSTSRLLSSNNHELSLSLTAVSSPCKSFFRSQRPNTPYALHPAFL